jgi:hypothetical protein
MKQWILSLRNKLVVGACALTCAASVSAQGTVNINNHVTGELVTRVYWMNTLALGSVQLGNGPNDTPAGSTQWDSFTPLSGTSFTAQVWAGNGFDQPESALQPAFPTTAFHTGAGAGSISPTMATLADVPAGGSATVTLRVWDNQCGTITNWAQAQSLGVSSGQSPLFNLCCVGGGIIPPADLVGLQSFNLGGCLSPYFSAWSTQPTNQVVLQGGTATFPAQASGCPAPSYQWYHDGVAVTSNTICTCGIYQIKNVQPSDAGNYWAVAYGLSSDHSPTNTTSGVATLTVGTLPTIISEPEDQTVPVSTAGDFSVVADGVPPLTYEWFFNTGPIPDVSSHHLHLSDVQASQAGGYRVVVIGPFGSVTSAWALLTVTGDAPTIQVPPRSQTVSLGSTADFSVVANGPPPLGYQWFFNVTNAIPGGATSVLELTNVQFSQAGTYKVLVTNAFGNVTSAAVRLTVLGPAPNPTNQTAEVGSIVSFQFRSEGYGSVLSYYWLFNGTSVLLPTATDGLLILSSVQMAQAGTYVTVVSNSMGSVTSAPAMLDVIPPVPRRMVPAVTMSAQPGSLLNLDFTDTLNTPTDWRLLERVYLTNAPQWYVDLSTPLPVQTFYRAWQSTAANDPPTLDIHSIPAIILAGQVGSSQRVDYINQFGPINAWVTLATVTLTNTIQLFPVIPMVGQPARLYRVIQNP